MVSLAVFPLMASVGLLWFLLGFASRLRIVQEIR
uniref:Uncharacterized protein n=1 Tax=Manihot esculenta TaxID=3983 RepID=A0A199UB60_MANES